VSDGLKVQFGDGVSAVDRTSRAIVMLTAQALDHLKGLGYVRGRHVEVDIHQDGLPVWVTLKGRRAFEIDFALGDDLPGLIVVGRWLFSPRRRWWGARLAAWVASLFRSQEDA